MSRLSRAGVGLVAAFAAGIGCADPDDAELSPFPFWGLRLGMPLDAVEQFFIRQDNRPWAECALIGEKFKRCWRHLMFLDGRVHALADARDRVVLLRIDVTDRTGRDLIFDNQLSVMEQGWFKVKGVRVDKGGLSPVQRVGTLTFSTARGRWTAAVTFDGHRCYGSTMPCPVRVELGDQRAGAPPLP